MEELHGKYSYPCKIAGGMESKIWDYKDGKCGDIWRFKKDICFQFQLLLRKLGY